MVATNTLKKIAFAGGFLALGGATIFKHLATQNFQNQGYYKESVKLLDGYPGLNDTFGMPVSHKKVDMGNSDLNYVMSHEARIAVPVVGTKANGKLHTWSTRLSTSDSWKVEKCDLEVNKKRWTFYIHPDAHTRHQLYDPNSTEREPGELTDLLIKQQPIKTDNVDTAENDTLQYVKKS